MYGRQSRNFGLSGHWMNKSSFEEILERDGKLVYTNVGDSMLPLIRQGRDHLVIKPNSGRLRTNDIPLFRRESGQYVLHRVMKVRADDYVMCGDNRWNLERGVTDSQIVGILASIIRDGKEIPLSCLSVRLYSIIWYILYPFRCLFLRFRSALRSRGKRK